MLNLLNNLKKRVSFTLQNENAQEEFPLGLVLLLVILLSILLYCFKDKILLLLS